MKKVKISKHEHNLLLLDNFLEMMLSERFAAQNTTIAYQADIEHFLLYVKELDKNVTEISFEEIGKYISVISLLSARSISRKISSIRQFFGFLISEGICKNNPISETQMPKKPMLLPKALSKKSIDRLLEHAKKDQTKNGIRVHAMLQMLYATGMRVSELISLKLNSVQKTKVDSREVRCVIINGKGDKERLSILHEEACQALDLYLSLKLSFTSGKQSNLLFASLNKKGQVAPFTRQRMGQVLKQIALDSGMDPTIVSPHKIRHSFATHLLQNGASIRIVQEMLGHSDISSTQIYIKTTNKDSMNLVLKHHPLSKA